MDRRDPGRGGMSPECTAAGSGSSPKSGGAACLLAPDEPTSFELVNPAGTHAAVLVCDHASNRVPRSLANLGLGPEQLASHIAWDPGAAEVARGLCARLDAPLILGGWSRLVIDLNRPLSNPESIPEDSDGVSVPGNLGLTPAARARRVSSLFDPYHRAVASLLGARLACPTMLFSIHSFTPVLGRKARPWHAGVACGTDRRLADSMIQALGRHGDHLYIGDNQPYGIDHIHDYTLPTHGEGRGIPHVMIEIRQDQLGSVASIDAWVERLADAVASVDA
jgi:predicted N-formylglutamate amidohydrolase